MKLRTIYNLCIMTLIYICWFLSRKTATKSVKWVTTGMNMVILLRKNAFRKLQILQRDGPLTP